MTQSAILSSIGSIPSNHVKILELKQKSIPEIVEETHLLPEICVYIKNSKQGYLKLCKISENSGYLLPNECEEGWCVCFGEGLSARVNRGVNYYYTSNIVKIDWDKKEFTTQNSTYSFELQDFSVEEMLEGLNGKLNCKHQET